MPRTIAPYREPVQSITLHAFGDASTQGVSAAVYEVIEQPSGVTQNLVAAKSCLAKRRLTVPRLELVAGHIATNMIVNVQQALDPPVAVTLHCWLDSTVALYWIQGRGEYKQFVMNRVQKIQNHANITWHHVPTKENPADLGSHGGEELDTLWKMGPKWLANPDEWPENPVTEPSAASNAEARVTREVLAAAIPVNDEFNELLSKHELWKTLRISAWIWRFVNNCRTPKANRDTGPLNTTETEKQKTWWTRKAQTDAKGTEQFQRDQVQLNLQENADGVLESRGRLEGQYPVYL